MPDSASLAPPPARLDFLDGLRGFAALGVTVNHYLVGYYPTMLTGDPATKHLPGHWEAWLAASPLLINFRISLFFVLSGLVLAESVRHLEPGWRALLAQVARRYVRLGVPVGVSVALSYLLLRTHSFYNQPAAAAAGSAWLGEFWHWMPTFRQFVGDACYGVMLRGEVLYNFALWTMLVEWRGSLLVLGVLAVAGRRPWRLVLYAALILLLVRVNLYYVAFLLGLSLHDIYQRGWTGRLPATRRRLLVGGLLLLAAAGASYPQTKFQLASANPVYRHLALPGLAPERTADFYHALGAFVLLGALLQAARLRQLLAGSFLRAVGKRAFSLYLLHFLLLGSGSAWLFVYLRSQLSYHLSFGLMFGLSLLVLSGLTELFYRWVDMPSHILARWVGRVVKAMLALVTIRRGAQS